MCYFVNYQTYKKIKRITFILKFVVPFAIVIYLAMYAFTPQSYIYKKPALVTIKRGSSLKEIAYNLYSKGVVNDPYLFYFIGFISGYSRYIEGGTYFVSANQSPASIYREFANGRVATVSVTIPPGLNIFQISRILAKKRVAGQRQFLKECFDRKFLLSLSIDGKSAEGFLYPDTYIFKIGSNPRSIIKEMISEFKLKIKDLNLKLKDKLDYKVLIIASMIIKEANGNDAGNMRLVSSVMRNRLKISMPLDIDSTSIYGENLSNYFNYIEKIAVQEKPGAISSTKNSQMTTGITGDSSQKYMKNTNGNNLADGLNRAHFKVLTRMKAAYLKVKSPYNTYLNYGLPPTPIANPDLRAVKAALNPSKTAYLYYISTKSGKVVFARTLTKQNENIGEYLTR